LYVIIKKKARKSRRKRGEGLMKKSSEIIKLYYQYQFTSSLKQNCIIKIHPDLANKRKFCILINKITNTFRI